MSEAVPYLAALANAAVLGVIGLMLRSLGRVVRPAPVVAAAPVELRTAALHQVKRDDSIVLNIDDFDFGAACPLPVAASVAGGRRHHHHH